MKWKEFFAATLPKPRKSRRKNTSNKQARPASPDQSGSVSSPECDDVIIRNQNLRTELQQRQSGKKKQRSSSTSKVHDVRLTQIAYVNQHVVSPDFAVYFGDGSGIPHNPRGTYIGAPPPYYEDGNTPLGLHTLSKSYSNASESGFEDGSDCQNGYCESANPSWCCGSSYGATDHSGSPQKPNIEATTSCVTQPDLLPCLNHTFPRERTRIKTNPWVSSPTKTMTSSMHSDVTFDHTIPMTPTATTTTTAANTTTTTTSDSENNNNNKSSTGNVLRVLTPNRNWNNRNYNAASATDSESSDTDWFSQSDKYPPREYPCNGNDDAFVMQDNDSEDDNLLKGDNVSGRAAVSGTTSKQAGVVKGGNLVIDLNTGDVFVKPKPVFSQVSFKYEENLNATLERDAGTRKRRTRRHRTEEHTQHEHHDHRSGRSDTLTRNSATQHDYINMDFGEDTSCTMPLLADSERDQPDSGTLTRGSGDHWTYQSSDTKTFRKRGLHKREPRQELECDVFGETAPLPLQSSGHYRSTNNSSYSYCTVDRIHRSATQRHRDRDVMFEASFYQRDMADSAYDSSTLSSSIGGGVGSASFHGHSVESSPPHRGHQTLSALDSRRRHSRGGDVRAKNRPDVAADCQRSLEEIHTSLRQKVERLKAEKRVVDEKVQQARDEDALKRDEKARIQKEVSSLRKQVLLKTLQELKENLEDQNSRLQEAYDDVLDMQWLNAKLRRLRNTTI